MLLDKKEYFFSHLTRMKVVDKDGKTVGKPGDALLDSETLQVKSLILFGSFLEEKMEDLKLKEDVDPIVPLGSIAEEKVSEKKIVLSEGHDQLEATSSGWTVPEGTIQFSKLKKVHVFDKDGNKIGTVIDIGYHEDGTYTLVLGGGFMEEFLEKIKVFADKDLLVPQKSISELGMDKITIKHSRKDLKTTIEENVAPEQIIAKHQVGFVPRGFSHQSFR